MLIPANLAATLLRFVLFRAWVFHPRRTCPPTPSSLPAPRPSPPCRVVAQPHTVEGDRRMTSTLPASRSGTGDRARLRTRPTATPRPSRLKQFWRGRPDDAPLGAAGAAGPAARHGRALPVGARGLRVRQQLLRRSRAGRHPELEGMVLRLARRVQLHHGRQAARLAVGDGPVGPPVRLQQLEHACAAGPRRGGDGRAAVRDGAAVVRPGRPGC